MTKEQALKLALEALEMFCEHGAILRPIETRNAIQEALAQPEQDYLAGVPPMLPQMRDGETIVVTEYAQPEQDPVATWENKYGMKEWQVHALRAGWSIAPPHRKPWVGLTDDEVSELSHHELWIKNFIRQVEAKLRSKNT